PTVSVWTTDAPQGGRSGGNSGQATPTMAATHSTTCSTIAGDGSRTDAPSRTCCADSVQPSTARTCGYSGTGTPRDRSSPRAGSRPAYRPAKVSSGNNFTPPGAPPGAVANHAPPPDTPDAERPP